MANANSPYQDGDWTIPQQDGRRKESFPFDFLGDGYAKIIERKYKQLGTSYTGPATITRTSYSNLLTYSADLGNAAWVKVHATIATDQIANPWDGSLTADKIQEDNQNSGHQAAQSITFTAVAREVWGIFKAAERSWVYMDATDSATATASAYFNIGTGAVGTTAGAIYNSSSITSLGNGWYLCQLAFTPAAGGGSVGVFTASADGVVGYPGITGNGIYCAQMQSEIGTIIGPVVITTSTTRTVSVPNLDSLDNPAKNGDPFSFLLTETPPADSDLSLGLIAFQRKYGRIPATEVEYTSRFVQRPVMDGAYIAPTYYTASIDGGVTSHIFNTRTAIIQTGTVAATISPNVVSVVVATHNFNVGDEAVLWWGNGIVARTPVLATAASFFYIALDAISAPSYAANFVQVTKNALVRYVNGNKNCSIKRSHYFYLPNYTVAGTIAVTTGADIPNYDVYTDPTAWLGRIVPTAAAATYAAIEVSAISYYEGQPGSPVLTQVVDEAQMADALDSIPV